MAEEFVHDKKLWNKLGSIKKPGEWVDAVERLGFRTSSGGKHPCVVRDPENLNNQDIKSLVATIPSGLHKNMNQIIFKEILKSSISARLGITEEKIWQALKFKK